MQGKLVLVVEDDALIRQLLTELLRPHGLRVATLPDAERVLEAARKLRPAAILLDIGLPGMHGLAVLDELRADPGLEGIPVVMATAWCDSEMVSRAMAAGAVGYLRKPFTEDELLQQVRSAVRGFESGVHTLPPEVRRVLEEDRLTGLANRLGTEAALAGRLADAGARFADLGVVLVRVDGWEAMCRAGDAASRDLLLRMLAGELQRQIRPGDLLGRWADDTFLVAAHECDLTATAGLARRLRRAVDSVRARAGWTISTGYASTATCEPDALVESCEQRYVCGDDAPTPGAGVPRLAA